MIPLSLYLDQGAEPVRRLGRHLHCALKPFRDIVVAPHLPQQPLDLSALAPA